MFYVQPYVWSFRTDGGTIYTNPVVNLDKVAAINRDTNDGFPAIVFTADFATAAGLVYAMWTYPTVDERDEEWASLLEKITPPREPRLHRDAEGRQLPGEG